VVEKVFPLPISFFSGVECLSGGALSLFFAPKFWFACHKDTSIFFCRPFLIGSICQKRWGWDFDKDMPWGCSGIQSFSKQNFGNDFSLTQEMKELCNDNCKKASITTK